MVRERIRKGKKGLYYTSGKLDQCDYNRYNCNIFQAYDLALQVFNNGGIMDILKAFCEASIALILCPFYIVFAGIIHKVYWHYKLEKEHGREKLIQEFPEDYYEVLWRDEDSEEEG